MQNKIEGKIHDEDKQMKKDTMRGHWTWRQFSTVGESHCCNRKSAGEGTAVVIVDVGKNVPN